MSAAELKKLEELQKLKAMRGNKKKEETKKEEEDLPKIKAPALPALV